MTPATPVRLLVTVSMVHRCARDCPHSQPPSPAPRRRRSPIAAGRQLLLLRPRPPRRRPSASAQHGRRRVQSAAACGSPRESLVHPSSSRVSRRFGAKNGPTFFPAQGARLPADGARATVHPLCSSGSVICAPRRSCFRLRCAARVSVPVAAAARHAPFGRRPAPRPSPPFFTVLSLLLSTRRGHFSAPRLCLPAALALEWLFMPVRWLAPSVVLRDVPLPRPCASAAARVRSWQWAPFARGPVPGPIEGPLDIVGHS